MKNVFGFSILELMIAAAVSGIAAIGVMQMTEEQVKVQKKVQIAFDVDTVISVVQKLILNQRACDATFASIPGNIGVGRSRIRQVFGPSVAPAAGRVLIDLSAGPTPFGGGGSNLQIESIEFVYRGDVGDVTNPTPGAPPVSKKIIGDIEVTVSRTSQYITNRGNNSYSGNVVRRLPFPAELVVSNTSNAFETCDSAAMDITTATIEEFCQMVTNDYGAVAGTNCNLAFNATESVPNNYFGAGLPNGTPGERGVSIGIVEGQITSLRDSTNLTEPTVLFNTGSETLFQYLPVEGIGTNIPFTFNFNNILNASLIIQDPPAIDDDVINVGYLTANLEDTTSCTGSNIGLAGNGGVLCFGNCANNEYAEGILNASGFNCKLIAKDMGDCPNDEGRLVVESDGAVAYQCCAASTLPGQWSSWSGCSATCDGYQSRTRSCPCGACGGDPLVQTQPCGAAAVDGTWSTWGAWGTCITGARSRLRTCDGGNACGEQCHLNATDVDTTCGGADVRYRCNNGTWETAGAACSPSSGVTCISGPAANHGTYRCCASSANPTITCRTSSGGPPGPDPACGSYTDFDLCNTTCLGKPGLGSVPLGCCTGYDTNPACE